MWLSCKYTFQSESTLYSCLNVKELLAWNRYNIWNLIENNGIWTKNHLAYKQILNHLANHWEIQISLKLNHWSWNEISSTAGHGI